MSWKGERMRHSMSARGIRSQADIQKEMDVLKSRMQLLNEEMSVYDKYQNINESYRNRLDEIQQQNMENTPLTIDELRLIYENLRDNLDEYLEFMYDSDYDDFLDSWEHFIDTSRGLDAYFDKADVLNFLSNEKNFDDEKEYTHDEVWDLYLDLDFGEFKEYLLNYHYGGARYFVDDHEDWIESEVATHFRLDDIEPSDALEYIIDHDWRDITDDRFHPTKEQMDEAWDDTLISYEMTHDDWEKLKNTVRVNNE